VRYLLVHVVDPDRFPPEDADEVASSLERWISYMEDSEFDQHGSRLQPAAAGRTVRVRDGAVIVSDGPFAETKEQIGGYNVIECRDRDQAIEVVTRHPTIGLGAIEIRPFFEP
jgi:hypothetical protein